VLDARAADRVVELLEHLEELEDVREIMDIVRAENYVPTTWKSP
jgi:hypothetical protein